MIIDLTNKDLLYFPDKKYLVSRGYLDNVDTFRIPEFKSMIFVEEFLKRRGIEKPKINEAACCEFSNVEMHVDNISPPSYATLVIMLSGKGRLIHTVRTKSKRQPFSTVSENIKVGGALVFDFHLPHQFKTAENCIAVLADVNRKQLERLV